MKKLIRTTFILLSLSFIAFDTNAAKIGQFYIKNPDGTKTYISPEDAEMRVRKGERNIFFHERGKREKIVLRHSDLFR